MMSEYLRSTVVGHQIKTDYIRIAPLRSALFDANTRSFELPCLMRVDLRQCGIRGRFQDLDARGSLTAGARERGWPSSAHKLHAAATDKISK